MVSSASNEKLIVLLEILKVLPKILINLPRILMVSSASNEKLMVLPEIPILMYFPRILMV